MNIGWKRQKFNKWIAVVGVCVLIAILAIGLIRHRKPEVLVEPPSDLTVSLVQGEEEETLIFSLNSGEYTVPEIAEGSAAKLVVNNYRKDIQTLHIWVEKEGQVVAEAEAVEPVEKLELDIRECGSYQVSFAVQCGEATTYYISGGTIFEKIVTGEEVKNQTVMQLADVSLTKNGQELVLVYPFTWSMQGYTFAMDGAIRFASSEEGTMKIQNQAAEDVAVTEIYCDTPLWDYHVGVLFGGFTEEIYYYVNARSVNNRSIDTTRIRIPSAEAWKRLITDGKLQLLEQTVTVVIDGDFALQKAHITKPVTVEFNGNITAPEGLVFACREAGTITIRTSGNVSSLAAAISLDAPLATVVWEGSDAPVWENINQYQNVAVYNGTVTDTYMGGTGSAGVVSAAIGTVPVTMDGYCMKVTGSYTRPVFITQENLHAELDTEGSAALVEQEGKYYCVVTDTQGQTKGYQILVESLQYTLPVVYINTDSGAAVTSKEEYVTGKFSINYNGFGEYADISDASMQIRGRGNSTWKLDKKPYKIKFESKTSLFGLTKSKEWVLLANHLDRSLMRNTLALEMAKLTDRLLFVPSSYPVDVFVNGVYQGVYSLGEQIEMKNGRIEGEAEKDSTELDTDYLLEWGGEGKETSFGDNCFSTPLSQWIEVKYPKEEILTEGQFQYIVDYMNKTDEAVKNLSGYEEYIDIPSLIDWFLVYEFSYNVDGIFRRSDYFLKKQGGKLYAAAPWDFDYAFGNFSLDSDNYHEWICLGNSRTDAYDGKYIRDNWMTYLLQDENFKTQLKARWAEIGEKMYQKALETIDKTEAQIGISAQENFTVWNRCLGVKLQYESRKTRNLDTFKEHVDYLRTFIENRYQWMNQTIQGM